MCPFLRIHQPKVSASNLVAKFRGSFHLYYPELLHAFNTQQDYHIVSNYDFSALNTALGSSLARVGHVWQAKFCFRVVSVFSPGSPVFAPPNGWRLKMSEIILAGRKTHIKSNYELSLLVTQP